MTEDQLKELLRQRAPQGRAPEDYAQHLLRSVQRRQRSELLRQPLWRLIWDRLQTALGEHSLSTPAYAGALAGLTLVGLISIFSLGSASRSLSNGALARQSPASERSPLSPAFPASPAPTLVASKPAPLATSPDKAAASSDPTSDPNKPLKRPLETMPVRFEKP